MNFQAIFSMLRFGLVFFGAIVLIIAILTFVSWLKKKTDSMSFCCNCGCGLDTDDKSFLDMMNINCPNCGYELNVNLGHKCRSATLGFWDLKRLRFGKRIEACKVET